MLLAVDYNFHYTPLVAVLVVNSTPSMSQALTILQQIFVQTLSSDVLDPSCQFNVGGEITTGYIELIMVFNL